ncbi:MAG TPA: hypothetical protein VMF08_04560 [Candidatus Sulfotelmatobacter sp.]|nr:hypothetical protein [Candidatus Sulfotelmatobacter sp.]
MKQTRSHEVGLMVSGSFIGFAIGIESYATFLLPANDHRSGTVMLVAISSAFIGLIILFLICAEMIREKMRSNK